MPEFDEERIVRRLEALSDIEPTAEAAQRVMERVREALANEGKALLFLTPECAEATLETLHGHPLGRDAAVIGTVEQSRRSGRVILETAIGTRRIVDVPLEAGLPRIC